MRLGNWKVVWMARMDLSYSFTGWTPPRLRCIRWLGGPPCKILHSEPYWSMLLCIASNMLFMSNQNIQLNRSK
jgi:hypothetical protein